MNFGRGIIGHTIPLGVNLELAVNKIAYEKIGFIIENFNSRKYIGGRK